MKVCSVCRRCCEDSAVSCAAECYEALVETQNGSPEMVAGYRLDFLLESGVRGRLFRARQIECGQTCLIKIIPADDDDRKRFLGEAKPAAAFFHPNLADIYEVGSLGSGEVFVVAEEPDGRTLREVLDSDGVPDLLTTIQIARQTAEALHAVHLKGLTHRALNPENIILTTDHQGELLVRLRNLDFGGLVERSIISNKFLIDSALDSIRYFAPEQCSGDGVGVQTDVYSLGIVLYEMLAGSPPFDAVKAAGLIEKHRSQQPPEIKIPNFELRMLLTHTLTESLQKKPRMRQPSANTFARQIRHMEQLATHVSTPPPAGAVRSTPVKAAISVSAAAAVPYASETVPVIVEPTAEIEKLIEIDKPEAYEIQEKGDEQQTPIVESVEMPVIVLKDENEERSLLVEPEIRPEPKPAPAIENAPSAPKLEKSAEKTFWLGRQVSRLKRHRKRLHTGSAHEAFEALVSKFRTVTGGTDLKREQPVSREAFVETSPEQVSAQPEQTAPVIARKPVHIEWEQPEDDIPSVADALEALSHEPITPIPTNQTESQNLPAATLFEENLFEPSGPEPIATVVTDRQIRTELAPPEDEIPFVADVPEVLPDVPKVLLKEQTIPTPVIQAEPPEKILNKPVFETVLEPAAPIFHRKPTFIEWDEPKTTPAQTEAALIEWGQLLKDTSSESDVRTVLPKRLPPQIPAVLAADTEEITLVRPPSSRFRINLEKPPQRSAPARRFSYRKPDSEFSLTLLGNSHSRKTFDPDARDGMFSAYYGQSAARFSSGRLMLSAIVGLTAVAAAFIFGGDLVTKYLQASGPGQPEASITKPSPVEPKKSLVPNKKRNARNAKSQRSDSNANGSEPGRTTNPSQNKKDMDSTSTDSRKKERPNGSEKTSSSKEPTRPRMVKDSKR